MKFGKLEFVFAAVLGVIVLIGAYGERELENLSQQVVRLHVIANSNSEEDQELKLHVRDAVLEKAMEITQQDKTPEQARESIENSLGDICSAAEKVVAQAGYGYTVAAQVGLEEYDTRVYDDFSLPAGEYTSLRVTIGAGEGKNWWCVVFPPLCTASVTEYEMVSAFALDDESEALITKDGGEYVIKFKLLEIIGVLKEKFGW